LDYTNGKEAIEWIVLKKTKNSVLLLSKYALDMLPYDKDEEYYNSPAITWETCSLRKWLNNDFIKSAFNKIEQSMIKTTNIKNFDNTVFKTAGGNDTKDEVFLLSQLEMIDTDLGFSEDYETYDVNRRCAFSWYKNRIDPTVYDEIATADGVHACDWWLRSPGAKFQACSVHVRGDVHSAGTACWYVGYNYIPYTSGVRPAMWIKIKS